MIGGEGAGSKPCSRVANPTRVQRQATHLHGLPDSAGDRKRETLRQQAVYLYAVVCGLYDVRVICYFGSRPHRCRIVLDGCILSLLAVASGYLLLLSVSLFLGSMFRSQLNGFIAFSCFAQRLHQAGSSRLLSLGDVRGWATWSSVSPRILKCRRRELRAV